MVAINYTTTLMHHMLNGRMRLCNVVLLYMDNKHNNKGLGEIVHPFNILSVLRLQCCRGSDRAYLQCT